MGGNDARKLKGGEFRKHDVRRLGGKKGSKGGLGKERRGLCIWKMPSRKKKKLPDTKKTRPQTQKNGKYGG